MTQSDPQNGPRMTLQTTPQTGPEIASDLPYPDLRYPIVQNRAYLTFLLVLLRRKTSRPRIGYARLLKAKNILMVVRILGYSQVINLGNSLEP